MDENSLDNEVIFATLQKEKLMFHGYRHDIDKAYLSLPS